MNPLKLAVNNISMHGDTDIFPFPVENSMFYDKPKEIFDILSEMEKNFDKWLSTYPVDAIRTCIPVGYTGFRWATAIDPLWNAFLLFQVLKISKNIETKRLTNDRLTVFSYRLKPDETSGTLFDKDINWRKFYDVAIGVANSGEFSYVVRFDISDFYNHVYHHRLDQALLRTNADVNVVKRIMKILQDIAVNVSYGLPVGGNASRILAELLLNSMDQSMLSKRIRFCRFVDDYILFAKSREDAFRKLNWCADYLLRNEGLALQKGKTQIQTCSEFMSHAKTVLEGGDKKGSKVRAEFLRLHLHYDPYSTTADQDYKDLKSRLNKFDIISIIKSEIRKSRIHQALGKQLMNAVRLLDGARLNLALNVLSSNLEALYPVFPSVMQVAYRKLLDADEAARNQFIDVLCKLIEDDSYIIQTDNNASYVARVLSLVSSDSTIQAVDTLNSRMSSPLVRSNCIYAMINLSSLYWLSDLKSKFSTLSKWERRAFIAASYFLRDEGKHWRDHTAEQFTILEQRLKEWVGSKNPLTSGWKLPL